MKVNRFGRAAILSPPRYLYYLPKASFGQGNHCSSFISIKAHKKIPMDKGFQILIYDLYVNTYDLYVIYSSIIRAMSLRELNGKVVYHNGENEKAECCYYRLRHR